MTAIINVTALQRAAENYDPLLRKLPFHILVEELDKLKINVLEVDQKDKVVQFQRKGGLAKPYVIGDDNAVSGSIGKAIERDLVVKACYAALKDHIMNYRTKRITGNTSEKVDNKGKKHPLEFLIIESKVRTVAEDILDALFFAERDEDDKSPQGMLDGFYTLVAKEIVAGDVAAAKGNLKTTGAIEAPSSSTDTAAYDLLVDFLRSANPYLRKNGVLYLSQSAMFYAMDALGNKINSKNAFEYDVFVNHLRGLAEAPRLELLRSPILGSGSQLVYTVPFNLDFGVNTKGDEQFVQVRDPYEDPNIAQFWTQWEAGARVTSIHPKEFMCNEQTNTGEPLSGDYS
jgi:hypothetical protein